MARIADAELERIKREVKVEGLARSRGVELERVGSQWRGRCPFHNDDTPSLFIEPEKNVWCCRGACNAGGSVVDWVMKAEQVSFLQAARLLEATLTTGEAPKLSMPVALDADDQTLLNQVTEFYHRAFKQSTEAQAYVETRGLKNGEMVEQFKLGLANRALGLRLPSRDRGDGAEIRARLTKLGVLRESGHEHLTGLVVPIIDEAKNVVGMYSRRIGPLPRAGAPTHLYLPGPHRGVWNASGLAASRTVVLCEAMIDALTFWCAGIRNVTASYGVNGLTAEHRELFKRNQLERVVVAYDADEAGDTAAQGVARELMSEGINCYRAQFPKGMDANEYAQKVKPAQRSLAVVVRRAAWMGGEGNRVLEDDVAELPGMSTTPEVAQPEIQGATRDNDVDIASTPVTTERPAPTSEPPLAPAIPATTETSELPQTTLSASPSSPPELPASVADPAAADATPATTEPTLVTPPDLTASMPPIPVVEPAVAGTTLSKTEPGLELKGDEVWLTFAERRYRIRGLTRNTSREVLKVNVFVSRGESIYVDTMDLYGSKAREHFVKHASAELSVSPEVVKADVVKLVKALDALQADEIRKALAPKAPVVELTDEEKAEALAFLKDERLLERIVNDFARCGVVGEEGNKLTAYLAAVSRKLDRPLAIMVQSNSAAGKSTLLDAVLAFVPEEERAKYSAMTERALYYVGETELVHKVLAVVEEAGAEPASYALKLLQSEGELRIASTGKDGTTGRLSTREYHVQGPVALFITTTKVELDAELENRCITLDVDESREQTRAIHEVQRARQTLDGLFARERREELLKVHRNAQRLLRPLHVVNQFANRLTFLDEKTRTRRDHEKYLGLIQAVALLRQHQREVKTGRWHGHEREYIEVTAADIEVANTLASTVMGRSLDDLGSQTRKFLHGLEEAVSTTCQQLGVERAEYRFSRRDVVEMTGWSYDQVRLHLARLVEREYVLVHRGVRGQSFVYELLYDGGGKDGGKFLVGLVDVAAAGRATTASLGDSGSGLGPPMGGHWGGNGRGLAGPETAKTTRPDAAELENDGSKPKKGERGLPGNGAGHVVEGSDR